MTYRVLVRRYICRISTITNILWVDYDNEGIHPGLQNDATQLDHWDVLDEVRAEVQSVISGQLAAEQALRVVSSVTDAVQSVLRRLFRRSANTSPRTSQEPMPRRSTDRTSGRRRVTAPSLPHRQSTEPISVATQVSPADLPPGLPAPELLQQDLEFDWKLEPIWVELNHYNNFPELGGLIDASLGSDDLSALNAVDPTSTEGIQGQSVEYPISGAAFQPLERNVQVSESGARGRESVIPAVGGGFTNSVGTTRRSLTPPRESNTLNDQEHPALAQQRRSISTISQQDLDLVGVGGLAADTMSQHERNFSTQRGVPGHSATRHERGPIGHTTSADPKIFNTHHTTS